MLQLEPESYHEHVKIKIKEKRSFFDRHLRQAFTYSVLFHALLFGVFRIKFTQVHDTAQAYNPVEVAIDTEQEDTSRQQAIAQVEDLPTKNAPYAIQSKLILSTPFQFDQALTSALLSKNMPESAAEVVAFGSEGLIDERLRENEAHDKLLFTERLYPLQLKLSKKLSRLELIEDGHKLFKMKTKQVTDAHLLLATNTYPISYKVHIQGKTGKVILWDRKKELIDKRLQEYADMIIQNLEFAPFQEEELKGKIQIVFKCDGVKLQEFLQ